MKKLLTICFGFIATIVLNTSAIAKIKTIKFCTLPFAPFVITDQNHQLINGFDTDLAKAMCKIIGAECKFVMQQQRITLIGSLNSGECDAWIGGFTISPDRKKYMDFTKSYYPSSASLIVPKNSTLTSKPDDLKNKKVGVTNGSNFMSYLTVTHRYDDIDMIKFANADNALIALKANKIDTLVSDTAILNYWIHQKDNENFRLIELPPYNKEFSLGRGYGIPVKKGNTALLNTLNHALAKVKTSGTYTELVKKYFTYN